MPRDFKLIPAQNKIALLSVLATFETLHVRRGMQEMIRAVELRAGPRTLERLGDAYTLAARDYRQALIAYRMAAEQTGANPSGEIYGKMARACYLAGDLEQASRIIGEGKKISPDDPGLWIANGLVQWKQGNWDEARRSLRSAIALTGGRSSIATLVTQFMGDPGEAGNMLSDLRSSQTGSGSIPTDRP